MEQLTELNEFNCLVRGRHGLYIANKNDFYVGNALISYGEYGEIEWEFLSQFVQSGSVVVEVGANIGTHTVAFAKAVGEAGRVIAVEPQRVIFQYLCANLSLNGLLNVETYHCGCGSDNDTLIVPEVDYGAAKRQNFGGISLGTSGKGEPVRIMKLDDLVAAGRWVDLIKIDVEGMESEVLKGASDIIRKYRPLLYVENDRLEKSEALIKQLFALDYRLYWHAPALFNKDNYFHEETDCYNNIVSYNMICVPRETAISIDLAQVGDPTEHPLIPNNSTDEELLTLALLYHDKSLFVAAESIYCKVLAHGNLSAEGYKNYGNTLLSLNRLSEAEQAYRQALELDSGYPEAYNNLGNLLRLDKRFDESEEAFQSALRLLPDNAEICNNYGNLLMDLGEIEKAEEVFRRAILLNPDFHLAYCNRGNALRVNGRFSPAIKCFRRAIELAPDYVAAYLGLGGALLFQGHLDEAEQTVQQALAISPGNTTAFISLGCIYGARRAFGEAEKVLLKTLAIKPDNVQALFNLSLLRLLQGRLTEGFALYENRFASGNTLSFRGINDFFSKMKDHERWSGQPAEGKSLLVVTEQGAGDSLMMVRYLPLLSQRGFARIFIYCEQNLLRLFQSVPAVTDVYSKEEPLLLEGFDYYCPMMSLPFLFGTEEATIPTTFQCLAIHEADLDKWRKEFIAVTGLKVGLVWAGSKINFADWKRSIPIGKLEQLLSLKGFYFVSLQKGAVSANHDEIGSMRTDLIDQCDDYLDTAALIANLDLVISVDTSVAHLAGLLGKPVWLLNRFESEWRWMLDRPDSPWYPTMRIFNQQQIGDWSEVIAEVTGELTKLV